MTEKTYSVPDVSCMHCKRAIEGAVGAMPGISEVEVDVEATVAEADVLATLAEEGYPVAR
jgi:copper chaperone CopZ